MTRPRPVVLCILDGWGHRLERENNAIAQARTPVFDRLLATCPHSLLKTAALEVGLPEGQFGNSEVGHMNLGSGRVVMQDLVRIDAAVADGGLGKLAPLTDLIAKLKANGGTCHLLGLVSPGGVHAHRAHIAALARSVAKAGVPVAIHAFLDGRDTPPKSAADYVAALEKDVAGVAGARIATVSGRYFAMDRDKRWDRVEKAYRVLVDAKGTAAKDAQAAIAASYTANVTDEFVQPVPVAGYAGMKDGDGLLVANFRADRIREILSALLEPGFNGFARARQVAFAGAVGMTSYSSALDKRLATLFPSSELRDTLGEIVSRAGLTQLRIAETEKYAHVTFFFNGGEERVFDGEQRIMVPSPKVATYDEKPEMSAFEVTEKLVGAIRSRDFDLVVVNFANTDMVGHTGSLAAAIKAVEAVDTCLGAVEAAVKDSGGVLLITADHGNAERMLDETGESHTQHTMDDVPFIVVGADDVSAARDGRLADVAPTVLALMGQPQPAAMTGQPLIIRAVLPARARDTARAGA